MKKISRVWTPDGILPGYINSLVGKGESLINYNTGKATLVTKGKVGVDNQPSSITSDDDNVIAGNDIDWIGYYQNKYSCGKDLFAHGKSSSEIGFKMPLSFALEHAPITVQIENLNAILDTFKAKNKKPELNSLAASDANVFNRLYLTAINPLLQKSKEITDRQKILHELQDLLNTMLANKGKDAERFANGTDMVNPWVRYGTYALPALLNGLQADYWARQRVHTPDIYASNPYELAALTRMASRHANPYNQWRAMLDAERRGEYAINQSGGYTGGQRQLARVAQNIGLQRNYADVLANANKEENQYASDWATLAANLGAQRAQRRQTANQYNTEAYDRAASRRATNYWKSIAGVGAALQQGFANEFKYRMGERTLNLYDQQNKIDWAKLKALYPDKDTTVFTPNKTTSNVASSTAPSNVAPLDRSLWNAANNAMIKVRNEYRGIRGAGPLPDVIPNYNPIETLKSYQNQQLALNNSLLSDSEGLDTYPENALFNNAAFIQRRGYGRFANGDVRYDMPYAVANNTGLDTWLTTTEPYMRHNIRSLIKFPYGIPTKYMYNK